jgi:hypothetical protein
VITQEGQNFLACPCRPLTVAAQDVMMCPENDSTYGIVVGRNSGRIIQVADIDRGELR